MIARTIRQIIALLAIALIPALVSGLVHWKKGSLPSAPRDEVTAETVRSWGDKVQWVDARKRAEFEDEHIEGAVLLNEEEWESLVNGFLDAWEPEEHVVVYCDGGGCEASHEVARRIRAELKIEDVWVLKGGIKAWPASH